MFSFALAFLLGDLWLQHFSQLPLILPVISMDIASVLLWLLMRKHLLYTYLPLAFALGFTWGLWYGQSLLSWSLLDAWEGQMLMATGEIASLPVTEQGRTRFSFYVEQLKYNHAFQTPHALVQLSSREMNQRFNVGDRWQFVVRLKRIHSTQNKGAFDYDAFAFQKGLRASGYILASNENQFLSHTRSHYLIDQFRQHLQEKISVHLPASRTAPWLMGLIIGERHGISPSDWQVLRRTGTNHLMAVAGLHIGLIAGFAFGVVTFLASCVSCLVLRCPASQIGAGAALLTALIYSAFAGFSLPTQRACVMLAVFILAKLRRRHLQAWHAWSLALFIVVWMNPLSVLSDSFWLSFGTIALVIYGMSGRMAPHRLWWTWGRMQWVIGLGLIPLTLFLFQEASLVSFIANTIAIPWLGFLILPFCFLASLFLFIAPGLGVWFLIIADKSLMGLWQVLTFFSEWPFSSWIHAVPNTWIVMSSVGGCLLLLLPRGFPGRMLGCLWLMPLLFYEPIKPAIGDIWLTVLDVGQGLSVVIQTASHTLVYDAGPKWSDRADSGANIVLPYLRTIATKQLDQLVISHGDNDHIGGAQAIVAGLSVTIVKTSVPDKFSATSVVYCLAGDTWQWDQVRFSFLYPDRDDLGLGNNSSCVLRIDNGQQSILLTGDIEKYAENQLLAHASEQLPVTILVAPHHGSKTSGLSAFVATVHPQFVVYATGYRNRYHFPQASVVMAYETVHSIAFNTAETGAIQFKLMRDQLSSIQLYRWAEQRYWMA